jgi:hypothetical protein
MLFGVIAALGVSSCAQEDIVLPDLGGSVAAGECSAAYPGGTELDTIYGNIEGDTFPCLVWESVRVGEGGDEPNTFIDARALYLQAKNGESEVLQSKWGVAAPTALIIMISTEPCAECTKLTAGLVDRRDELEAAGAVLVGVCRDTLSEQDIDLGQADAVLLESDGWLPDWHRTNDAEHFLELGSSFPQVIAVRLRDMLVVHSTAGIQGSGGGDADDLLALVEDIAEL